MTGPYESIIGFRVDRVLQRFLLQTPVALRGRQARRAAGRRCSSTSTRQTGQARGIERLLIPDRGALMMPRRADATPARSLAGALRQAPGRGSSR